MKVVKTLELTIKTAEVVEDESLSKKLLDISEEFLSKVWVPRDTDTYLMTAPEDPGIKDEIKNTWSTPEFKEFTGVKLPEELRNQILKEFENSKRSWTK